VQGVERPYQDLRQEAARANPELFARRTTNPRAKPALPTPKELVAFLLSGHLGQLSSWQRMTGLMPMF